VSADLAEEDEALVAPQASNFSAEEYDIDNGEFWGDAEESDIDYDLDVGECNERGAVTSEDMPQDNQYDQGEFHKASTIIIFLSVAVSMWSYRYNVTHGALNALLKLLWLFVSIISTSLSSSVSST
jgi:hypothetical protein